MKFPFRNNRERAEDEENLLKDSVTDASVEAAYLKRKAEIDSLRQYDRGEKKIIAPDIRTLVRSL